MLNRFMMPVLLAPVTGALAQPQLPQAVRQADRIGGTEREQIRDFCDHWVGQLTDFEGEDEALGAVAEARQRLAGVFDGDISSTFRREYERMLGDRLAEALGHDEMVVRLNAMIVASNFRTSAIAPLLESAATDENAAIRYWAARGANLLVESRRDAGDVRTGLDSDLQRELLRIFGPLVESEASPFIFQQFAEALSFLSITEADEVLLEGLIERLRLYLDDPDISPAGVRTALGNVSVKRFARVDDVDGDTRRLIIRTSFLYLRAYFTLSRADDGIDRDHEGWRRLAARASNVLRPWCNAMEVDLDQMPARFAVAAPRPEALWQARFDWEDDVLTARLGFTSEDLALPASN